MLIQCERHGLQPGLHTSADVQVHSKKNPEPSEIVDIIYTYLDQNASSYHVSRRFAHEHGLSSGVFPLPDDSSDWERKAVPCCVACFKEAHHGHFDKNGSQRSLQRSRPSFTRTAARTSD